MIIVCMTSKNLNENYAFHNMVSSFSKKCGIYGRRRWLQPEELGEEE